MVLSALVEISSAEKYFQSPSSRNKGGFFSALLGLDMVMQLALASEIWVWDVSQKHLVANAKLSCSRFPFHWTLWKHYWHEGQPSWEISQSCTRFVGVRNKALLLSHWDWRLVVIAAKPGVFWLIQRPWFFLLVALQTLRYCYRLHDLGQVTAIVAFKFMRQEEEHTYSF